MALPPPALATAACVAAFGAALAASYVTVDRREATGVPAVYRRVQGWTTALAERDLATAAKYVFPDDANTRLADDVLPRLSTAFARALVRVEKIDLSGSGRGPEARVELHVLREVRSYGQRGVAENREQFAWKQGPDGAWYVLLTER